MILDSSQKFIIHAENMKFVTYNIIKSGDYNLLMDQVIMTRTIFEIPNNDQGKSWLRIRVGDIDCDNNQLCTITLKQKSAISGGIPMSAKLVVADYYEAIHMFKSIGMRKTSMQETKRTKYICFYESIKYIICFDEWPSLGDIMFITITPGSNAEPNDISGFLDLLNIDEYAIKRNENVDVDNEYIERFGHPASDVPRLSFHFPIRGYAAKNVVYA